MDLKKLLQFLAGAGALQKAAQQGGPQQGPQGQQQPIPGYVQQAIQQQMQGRTPPFMPQGPQSPMGMPPGPQQPLPPGLQGPPSPQDQQSQLMKLIAMLSGGQQQQ